VGGPCSDSVLWRSGSQCAIEARDHRVRSTLSQPTSERRAVSVSMGHKQTCTRHVGRAIALSIEPFYNPSGRRVLLAREQRRLAAIVTADVVGYSHAACEQLHYSSLMPRTYLCARSLETLD
jgi:hypothetical protein